MLTTESIIYSSIIALSVIALSGLMVSDADAECVASGYDEFCCGGFLYIDPTKTFSCCGESICKNEEMIDPLDAEDYEDDEDSADKAVQDDKEDDDDGKNNDDDDAKDGDGGDDEDDDAKKLHKDKDEDEKSEESTTETPAETIINDARYCDGNQLNKLPGNNDHLDYNIIRRSLPVDSFVRIVCQQSTYYLASQVADYYFCCGSTAYDFRTESCRQIYRLPDVFIQTPVSVCVQQIEEDVAPERGALVCDAGTFIFDSAATASRHGCF